MAARPAAVGGVATYRCFSDRPPPSFVDAVRAHIARTGQPETFVDLHPGPIRRDEPFHKLAKIRVPQEKRPDGDMAPCPMCRPDKFLEGWLVYFFELRAAAFIGHCCASHDTRAEADREWAERQTRDREEGYLLAVLPKLDDWLTTLDGVRAPIEEAQRFFRAFRREGATFYQALRTIRANGGRLVATEIIRRAESGGPTGMRTRGSSVQTRDVDFGTLSGMTAVLSDYHPARTLDEIRAAIAAHVQPDEEAAINYITGLAAARRAAVYRALRKAARDFTALLGSLEDFRAFFAASNLSRISQWAAHPDAPVGFRASFGTPNAAGERPLMFDTKGVYFHFKIRSDLWQETNGLALNEPVEQEG